jgi:hypothetical protein
MQNHQLTRQRNNGNGLEIARQRLASQQLQQQSGFTRQQMRNIPQGPGGVDVAGCGPVFNQGMAQVAPNDPWNSAQGFIGLPDNAPFQDPNVIRLNLYRLGIIVQANAGVRTVEVAPQNGANLYVAGIVSLNDPFQIILNSVAQGGLGITSIVDVDAACFNCDTCYCPADIGCANNQTPIVISFSAFQTQSTLPYLNLVLVGTLDAGRGCGVPWSPTPSFCGPNWGQLGGMGMGGGLLPAGPMG